MNSLVALVYSDHADPGAGAAASPLRPAHVVRAEIPVIVETFSGTWAGRSWLCPWDRTSSKEPASWPCAPPDLVINLCEDLLGDSAHEMHFTGLMELLGLAYTGSPPLALGLCRDKGRPRLS